MCGCGVVGWVRVSSIVDEIVAIGHAHWSDARCRVCARASLICGSLCVFGENRGREPESGERERGELHAEDLLGVRYGTVEMVYSHTTSTKDTLHSE